MDNSLNKSFAHSVSGTIEKLWLEGTSGRHLIWPLPQTRITAARAGCWGLACLSIISSFTRACSSAFQKKKTVSSTDLCLLFSRSNKSSSLSFFSYIRYSRPITTWVASTRLSRYQLYSNCFPPLGRIFTYFAIHSSHPNILLLATSGHNCNFTLYQSFIGFSLIYSRCQRYLKNKRDAGSLF